MMRMIRLRIGTIFGLLICYCHCSGMPITTLIADCSLDFFSTNCLHFTFFVSFVQVKFYSRNPKRKAPSDDLLEHTLSYHNFCNSIFLVGYQNKNSMGKYLIYQFASTPVVAFFKFEGRWSFGLQLFNFCSQNSQIYIIKNQYKGQYLIIQFILIINIFFKKMSLPNDIKLNSKSSQSDLIYEYNGIKLPLLEMTDPYYPHSKLAKSIFSGYYILFFMYSVIFMFTYPLLNYLEGEDLFGMTIIKLVQTNILWDIISTVLFLFLAMVFTKLSDILTMVPAKFLMILSVVAFLSSSLFIVRTYSMYFSDRIFIVVLSWALCVKTLSYIHDKNQQRQKNKQCEYWSNIQQLKQNKMNKLTKRLLYLISPFPIYHKFVLEHNPKLKIHFRYLITKFFVSFLCVFVSNTLIVKFIQPACQETNLSFIALTFKLVPLTFYINMVLYYMVMDNVIAALAEITKIQNRMFYLDWWNAKTIYQFLDRWCLIINMSTEGLFPNLSLRVRHTFHVGILQILLLAIFGKQLSLLACIGFIFIILVVYFVGYIHQIQNNMIVHILCMSFTPIMIAVQVKFNIFSKGILS